MTQQTPFYPLGGGLDLITPAISLKGGSAIAASNYEPIFGGYRRLTGYERFDGQLSPTDTAGFWRVSFVGGTGAINAGDLIVGDSNGALAIAKSNAVVTSGSYGAFNAAGYIDLDALSGDFSLNEYLAVGGVLKMRATGPAVSQLSAVPATQAAELAAALAVVRARIGAVPGQGSVLGVWEYKGNIYAFRPKSASTDIGMWKATTAGWVEIAFGKTLSFTSAGVYETVAGNTVTGATSGATGVVNAIIVQSGSFAAGDAAGYMVLSGQTGNFVAENLNVGANLNVMTIASNSAQMTLSGDPSSRFEFVNHAFSGNDVTMFGAYGGGPAFSFNGTTLIPISTGMVPDRPIRIAVHQNALFLGFSRGSVQFSAVGDPYSWSVILGAGEFNIGCEITDFLPATKTALIILGEKNVNVLYGSDSASYTLETLTDESGGYAWSADKVGQALYMDKGGVRSISATSAFGNFAFGTKTRKIQPMIQQKVRNGVVPTGTIRLRTKDQYRIFFSDMSGLALHLGGREPEVMPIDIGKLVTCICSAETTTGEEVYFGSDDGYVYQMEKGTSFDGAAITYFLRLPFAHFGGPQQRKRFHKAVLECEAAPNTTLYVTADYDYGDPYELGTPVAFPAPSVFAVQGGGGEWDAVNWNEFYWSAAVEGLAEVYLDGVAKNMSLLIAGEADDEAPHTLQGITYFITPRGLVR